MVRRAVVVGVLALLMIASVPVGAVAGTRTDAATPASSPRATAVQTADDPFRTVRNLSSGARYWQGWVVRFDATGIVTDPADASEEARTFRVRQVTGDGALGNLVATVRIDEDGIGTVDTADFSGRVALVYKGEPVYLLDGTAYLEDPPDNATVTLRASDWRVRPQTLSVNWTDRTVYNGQSVQLTIDSNRRRSVLAVSSPLLNFTQLRAIFSPPDFAADFDARRDEDVLLLNVTAGHQYRLNITRAEVGLNQLEFRGADTTASLTTGFVVQSPPAKTGANPLGAPRFLSVEREDDAGDLLRVRVACEECYLVVGGPREDVLDVIRLNDTDPANRPGNGIVTLTINTRYLGLYAGDDGVPSDVEVYDAEPAFQETTLPLDSGTVYQQGRLVSFDGSEIIPRPSESLRRNRTFGIYRVTSNGGLGERITEFAINESGRATISTSLLSGRVVILYDGQPVLVRDGVGVLGGGSVQASSWTVRADLATSVDEVDRYGPNRDFSSAFISRGFGLDQLRDLLGMRRVGRTQPIDAGAYDFRLATTDRLAAESQLVLDAGRVNELIVRDETDTETVFLDGDSLRGIESYVATTPITAATTPEELEAAIVPRDEVALGDQVVFAIDVTSVFGYLRTQAPNRIAQIVQPNPEGLDFALRTVPEADRSNAIDLVRSDSRLLVDESDERLYVVLDTGDVFGSTLRAGERYRATFSLRGVSASVRAYNVSRGPASHGGYPYLPPGDRKRVRTAVTFVERTATVDTDGDARLQVDRAPTNVTGTATVAPGTVLSVTAREANSSSPWVKTRTVVVRPDGTWSVRFDFGDVQPGDGFRLTVSSGSGGTVFARTEGRVTAATRETTTAVTTAITTTGRAGTTVPTTTTAPGTAAGPPTTTVDGGGGLLAGLNSFLANLPVRAIGIVAVLFLAAGGIFVFLRRNY